MTAITLTLDLAEDEPNGSLSWDGGSLDVSGYERTGPRSLRFTVSYDAEWIALLERLGAILKA